MPKKRGSAKKAQYITSEVFYSDVQLDNMLCAILIRSPQASGTLVSINTPPLPDGYALFSAKDIPGNNDILTLGVPTPIFCKDLIHYMGEPLAILVGPDYKTLQSIYKKTEILIEPSLKMDTITTFATKELAIGLAQTSFSEFLDLFKTDENVQVTEEDSQTHSDKTQTQVITNTWTSSLHHPSYTETNGALCSVKGNTLSVYTPTQWISHLNQTLSDVLLIDKKNIHIEKTRSVNTSINGIWRNAVFATQTALAAIKTGKPVKFTLTRQEQEIFMERAIPVIISNRSVVDKNGVIIAMDISIDLDMGYTNPFASEILDRLIIASCGIYNIKNVHIKATAHSSHTPPSSLDIDSIDSQSFFAIENQIQRIAEITGISPLELRKTNIKQKSTPQYMPFSFQFDFLEKSLDTVCKLSDFNRKYVTYRYASQDRLSDPSMNNSILAARGTGLACGFCGSGYFSPVLHATDQQLEVTLEKDNTVTLHANIPSKPIQTIWKTIVAQQLHIDNLNDIRIEATFAPDDQPQLPESAYSNITVMMQLLKKCCTAINRKKASQELPITVKKGITPAMRKVWNAETFTGIPFQTTALASAVVDLELDPSTYKQILRGIWVVVDAGQILSGKNAENTIKLDIQRMLSVLISNESIECPLIDIRFIQSDSEPKQIHGLIQNILPAAFTSALSQALSNTITDIPLLQKTLFIKGSHA